MTLALLVNKMKICCRAEQDDFKSLCSQIDEGKSRGNFDFGSGFWLVKIQIQTFSSKQKNFISEKVSDFSFEKNASSCTLKSSER